MKKFVPIFASFSILAALAGCGGGGDDPVAKYVGTWEGCIAGTTGSTRETIVITKKDDNNANAAATIVLYSGAGCSGTTSAPTQHLLTYAFKGTKTVDGDTVDRVDMIESAVTQKNVFVIKGGQFRFGPDNGPRDADGYPNTLDPDFLTKK